MTVKEIKEGMTAPEVAEVIKENFEELNNEKATKEGLSELESEVELIELLNKGIIIDSSLEAIKFSGSGVWNPATETITYNKKIRVDKIKTILLDGDEKFAVGVLYYDRQMNYIGYSWYSVKTTVDIKDGAYYAVFSFRRADQSDGFTEEELLGYNIRMRCNDSNFTIMLKSLSFIQTNGNSVVWADGSDGNIINAVYNEDVLAYESFEVSHINSGLKVIQPKITYDDDYSIKNRPQLEISKI